MDWNEKKVTKYNKGALRCMYIYLHSKAGTHIVLNSKTGWMARCVCVGPYLNSLPEDEWNVV